MPRSVDRGIFLSTFRPAGALQPRYYPARAAGHEYADAAGEGRGRGVLQPAGGKDRGHGGEHRGYLAQPGAGEEAQVQNSSPAVTTNSETTVAAAPGIKPPRSSGRYTYTAAQT